MPQGFMGQKEFISVTGDISTRLWQGRQCKNISTTPSLSLFLSTERWGWFLA